MENAYINIRSLTPFSDFLVDEAAFGAWRRLPRGFSREFTERMLAVWRRLDGTRVSKLGGTSFQRAARVLGPELAGKLFRRLQNASYDSCRTMTDNEFTAILREIPRVQFEPATNPEA